MDTRTQDALARAAFVRDHLPPGGLFADQHWRIAPEPFRLEAKLAKELESLGRVLLQFYRAVNLLYRHSAEGKQPDWVARLLDQGKPSDLIERQRSPAFKSDVPRVIRPDILLTADGYRIIELDSVPGGIGLTAWLNQTYSQLDLSPETTGSSRPIGGADEMMRGFAGIFGDADTVHLVVSEESGTYRPEMQWLAAQLGEDRFKVQSTTFTGFQTGDAVYRFFELFDLANVPNAKTILDLAEKKEIRLTPPPKTIFEEKLLFALLWNRNLEGYWRRELGEGFFRRLRGIVSYSWAIDPTPLPPHAAYPELNLTDWHQLKSLSQRERDLILKVSGFSENAWGARGVYLGSDLSLAEWSAAVDEALAGFERSPYVLQRYEKPKSVEARYIDPDRGEVQPMTGRVRLCPYYFVTGDNEAARAHLGGILATICPADKKIIHGMQDAILAPCMAYES
jgi:hypothetical protein